MKIPLIEWASKRYSPIPPIFTLRKWARSGELGPTVERVGKEWYVDENAERLSVLVPDGGAERVLGTNRTKTAEYNQPIEIPVRLRMDAVGLSLADLLAQRTGVVSPYLVHHVKPYGNAPRGAAVHPDTISRALTEARTLADIPDVLPNGKTAPTFHEIRSLALRLYKKQGNVDTKALAQHSQDKTHAVYQDPRGIEAIRVRVG